MTNKADVKPTIEQSIVTFFPTIILGNNAVIGVAGTFEFTSTSDRDRELAVNLKGALLFLQVCNPHSTTGITASRRSPSAPAISTYR